MRSSYGGYFAIGAFMAILMLLAVERWPEWTGWKQAALPVTVGALAALSDHKLVLLPASIALWMVLVAWQSRSATFVSAVQRAATQPVVVGFLLGTAAYWAYGLAIAPQAFWTDHVRSHLVDRITHENPLGYGGYATPMGLWLEFIRHTAFVVLPAALAFLSTTCGLRVPEFASQIVVSG